MTALYLIASEYKAAAEQLADLELPPEVVADTLEGLAGDLEVKAVSVAMFVRNLQATAAAIKQAEEEMANRRKAMEKRAEQITDYLLQNMQRCEISKIESPHFKIALQNNPPSVVIDDAGSIPTELYTYPEAPAPYPDKKAIGAMIKAGVEVPGAHLETKQRLVIK